MQSLGRGNLCLQILTVLIMFSFLIFLSLHWGVTCLQAWTFWITLDPVHEFHLYFCLGRNHEINGEAAEAIRAFEHAVEIEHSCSEQRWKQSTEPEVVQIHLGILYRWRTTSCIHIYTFHSYYNYYMYVLPRLQPGNGASTGSNQCM